jgi:hypothetical protein
VVGASVIGTCVVAICVVVAWIVVPWIVVAWAEVSVPGTDRAFNFAAGWPVLEVGLLSGGFVAFVGGFVTAGFVATGSVCVVSASEIPPAMVVSETVTMPMVLTVVVVRRFGGGKVDPEPGLGVFGFGVVFCGRTRTSRCFAAALVTEAPFGIVPAGFATAVAFGVVAWVFPTVIADTDKAVRETRTPAETRCPRLVILAMRWKGAGLTAEPAPSRGRKRHQDNIEPGNASWEGAKIGGIDRPTTAHRQVEAA